MDPIAATKAKLSLAQAMQELERTSTTLQHKMNWLKTHRSTDPIQQMQTDAILDLCDAVKKIQQAIWPMSLLIPDVESVKNAAGGSTTTIKAAVPIKGFV